MITLLKLFFQRNKPASNSIRLYITKKAVNTIAKLTCRITPKKQPNNLNSQILAEAHKKLSIYTQKERELITQREEKQHDNNLQQLIDAVFTMAIYLAETDPYYELWLGEVIKQLSDTRNRMRRQYATVLRENVKKTAPEYLSMLTPKFCSRAFDLKTCGGLHLLVEKLEKR